MKLNKKSMLIVLAIIAVATVSFVGGCKKQPADDNTPPNAAQVICPKCGQFEATELCCQPGQEKCSECNMVKGSPGCCPSARM